MPCLTPYRGDSAQLLLFKIASCLEANPGGAVTAAQIIAALGCTPACEGDVVNSFNGQTGDVVLTLADISTLADGRYVLKAGDTMTGALVHPDGTAALPSITFTGDLDTGIYRIGANSFGSSAGGALILAVSTTGINLTTALAYQYNSVNVIRAITADSNYFFGPSGNLTMTGTLNTAVGASALLNNTSGAVNTAIGANALQSNTTGSGNTAFGRNTMPASLTSSNNSAFGANVLAAFLSGPGANTSLGSSSLTNLTTGYQNTVVGYNTGVGITTGFNNTILGANVTGLAAALSNNIIIADGAGNQRIQVGSTGIVTIPIALTLSTAAPLSMVSGANQRCGDAVLVGGTVTVANTTVTANTRVFLTRKVAGGTIGFAVTYTLIAATSFTITSDNVLDTSTYSYLLIEVP